jgi:hypothetical protein
VMRRCSGCCLMSLKHAVLGLDSLRRCLVSDVAVMRSGIESLRGWSCAGSSPAVTPLSGLV